MRTLKILFLTGLLVAAAANAMAEPASHGTDTMGLYFDAEAVSNVLTLAEPATVDLYLIFTNPTMDFINGWQAKVTISAGAAITGATFPVGTTAILDGPSEWTTTMSSPMPCNTLTKLAVFSLASEAQDETLLYLGGVDTPLKVGALPTVKLLDGSFAEVSVSSGDPSVPLAGINSSTANEVASWGSLKSLFR